MHIHQATHLDSGLVFFCLRRILGRHYLICSCMELPEGLVDNLLSLGHLTIVCVAAETVEVLDRVGNHIGLLSADMLQV